MNIIALAGFIGAFMLAWIDGANNAANSIGTLIGVKALDVRKALLVAAVFELIGGLVYGHYISTTLTSTLINTSEVQPTIIAPGFTIALFTSFMIVYTATRIHIPFSISIVVVGALSGVALAVKPESLNLALLAGLLVLWIIIPFTGTAAGFLYYKLYAFLRSRRNIYVRTVIPLLLLYTVFTISAVYMAIPSELVGNIALSSTIMAIIAVPPLLVILYTRRATSSRVEAREDLEDFVSRFNNKMLLASSSILAFTHGGHDVANASAPLMVILESTGSEYSNRMLLILAYSSLGISMGVLMWGISVARTIGEEITLLSPESALIANIAGAQATLIVTRLGLPSSMVGIIVGSIMGVGFARGVSKVNTGLFTRILAYWYIGFTIAMILTFTTTRLLLALGV